MPEFAEHANIPTNNAQILANNAQIWNNSKLSMWIKYFFKKAFFLIILTFLVYLLVLLTVLGFTYLFYLLFSALLTFFTYFFGFTFFFLLIFETTHVWKNTFFIIRKIGLNNNPEIRNTYTNLLNARFSAIFSFFNPNNFQSDGPVIPIYSYTKPRMETRTAKVGLVLRVN